MSNEVRVNGTVTGRVSTSQSIHGTITGSIAGGNSINGSITETVLRGERGYRMEVRSYNNYIQYKYEDEDENEWKNLFNLSISDYEQLANLPTVNGGKVIGEMNGNILTPPDVVTNMELEILLSNT